MPPTFAQAERRNFTTPAIIIVALILIGFAWVHFFVPHRAVDAQITRVSVVPKHFAFAGPTTGPRVVGASDIAEDDLYVLATVHIHNGLTLPLFIKDLTGTLTTSDGADTSTSAIEKNDLEQVYAAVPELKSSSGHLLLRETEIAPGASAEGTVLLHFPTTEATWKQRKSASVTVEFYHQGSITVPIQQ